MALVALVGGLAYRMGWLSKVPSVSAVSAATSAIASAAKNTPVLRKEVPDVFDGQIPPHSVEPATGAAAPAEASAPLPVTAAKALSGASPVVEQPATAQPLTSMTLNTGAPEISLDAPSVSEALTPSGIENALPHISINL